MKKRLSGIGIRKKTKSSGPKRKEFVRVMRNKNRQLVLGWHEPEFVKAQLPQPKPTVSGQHALGTLLRDRAKRNVQLFNAQIARLGNVKRVRVPSWLLPIIRYPVASTDFNTWYQGSRSKEKARALSTKTRIAEAQRKKGRGNFEAAARRQREINARLHNERAFNFGVNSILEVGNDGKGNPTHILVLRRSKVSPEAPGWWDLPAGLVREKADPFEIIKKRVSSEVGVKDSELQLVGPGLKPTRERTAFALHRFDRPINYNLVLVHRLNIPVEEIRRTIRKRINEGKKKRDPWAPIGFALIPRNPKAIRRFLASHDKTWMPEVFRLYSMELSRTKKQI